MFIRKAYCQNWYPQKKEEIVKYLSPQKEKVNAQLSFAVVPHAGWLYSGKVAGAVYSLLPDADTVIFVATNHTGLGGGISLFPEGKWEMPFGSVSTDGKFSKELLKHSKFLKEDVEAHCYEHAIEVQLPFLQVLNPQTKIIPIEMRDYRLESCRDIGQAIAKTIRELLKKNPKNKFSVIASTDMTHCGEPYGQFPPEKMSADDFARSQDKIAIEQILKMNSERLLEVVKENEITMCGSGPAAAIIETAKMLGANQTRLVAYSTSADVSGKESEIAVGYAGILISS